jgi:iron complex transport system permease protein
VLWQIRLPRILAAMMIGGGLSAAGAAYQGLFRNPMVSPDLLGASAGAGLGAALGILFSLGTVGVQVFSFLGGLAAVALTYSIGKRVGRCQGVTLGLVLSGILVATLFSSTISFIKYAADPYGKLPAITFWLMGGLSSVSSEDVLWILLPTGLLGIVPLLGLRWRLNVMSFGEEEAMAMGVDPAKVRVVVVVCATLLTSAAVSVGGIIGWVGLLVPHLARMAVGPNYRLLLPASLVLGGSYLLLIDDAARCLSRVEIPLGILTAWAGTPFFVYLMLRSKRSWA